MKLAQPNRRVLPFSNYSSMQPHKLQWTRTTNEWRGPRKARRRKTKVRTPLLKTRQLSTHCERYVVAGKVAGAKDNFGGFGALSANFAHILDLSITQNAGTADTCQKVQRAALDHLARERGNLLSRNHRDHLIQCINDQQE